MLNHLSLQSQNLDLYGMRGNPMTLVQNRIFPWTTLYVGNNLWLSTPAIQQGRILFPANFQSWQVTAGVNVTLFEKRFKDEKRERKEAKAGSFGKSFEQRNGRIESFEVARSF